MSFGGISDNQKRGNYRGKCIYLMMLIKQKCSPAWDRLNEDFKKISIDETYDFYERLLLELKQIQDNGGKDMGPVEVLKEEKAPQYKIIGADEKAGGGKVEKKEDKKEEKKVTKKTKKTKKTEKRVVKKEEKREEKKEEKSVKKAAKKTAKKAEKKPTKKKTAKKKVSKKASKKTATKASKKKTAKKKAKKKS